MNNGGPSPPGIPLFPKHGIVFDTGAWRATGVIKTKENI
jgi:hypothetical protein